MNSLPTFLYLFFVFILSFTCIFAADYQVGQTYYGFKLLDKRFVKEVNAECLYFQHVKSGAKLFKMAADDANKTFMIAFKTDPESDAGTPHIMEHSVLTASKVQYVLQGYDFKKLGYSWDGSIRVMNKIVSRDWLYNRIRVVGGAYGGAGRVSSTGRVYYYSYRDPNLKETIDNFAAMKEFLNTFNASEKDMTGYIIGTIGDMDSPMTPSQQGNTALAYWFQKTTPEQLQKERDQALSTTADDVKNMSQLVADLIAQKNYCVYGNEEKIKANKELFGELVPLIK
jgi:Zn-dependent M16 (insulinase) family peptidase